MVISIVISLLSLMIAVGALWTAYEISNKQHYRRLELANDHAVEIARLQSNHNDVIGRLRQQYSILDGELQTFRQEFRQATRINRMEIGKLSIICEKLTHGRDNPLPPFNFVKVVARVECDVIQGVSLI